MSATGVTTVAYTIATAAEATGLSRKTIERAVKAGKLRAKRSSLTPDGEPTGSYVIPAPALAAWIDSLADA